MKKISVYLLSLLLVCSMALTFIPLAHSQVVSVKVLNYSYYQDSIGYIVVVGEIQNQGPNNIETVVLTGIITDSTGAQSSSYAAVWGRNIIPNQKAPFYMEFQPQTQEGTALADISTVEIKVYNADPSASYQYPNLAVINQQSYIGTNHGTPSTTNQPSNGDFGVYWVTGNIQNTGTQTAGNITVYSTFYNSNGDPVAVGYSAKTNSLAAGASASFKLGAFDLNQSVVPSDKKIATYSLLIQTETPLLEGSAPVPVATPTPPPVSNITPTPTNSDGSTSAPNDNNSQMPTWIYATIAAVAIILVVGLLLVKKRSKPKKPKFR